MHFVDDIAVLFRSVIYCNKSGIGTICLSVCMYVCMSLSVRRNSQSILTKLHSVALGPKHKEK